MKLRLLVPAVALAGSAACSVMGIHATPEAVLDAYLDALADGDCRRAAAYATPEGIEAHSAWCDSTGITSRGSIGVPDRPDTNEALFYVEVVIRGGDGWLPDGSHGVFAQVLRQPDGRWLVHGLGSES